MPPALCLCTDARRGEFLNNLSQDEASVLGEGADLLVPATELARLDPGLAGEHVGAVDLVERRVFRHALAGELPPLTAGQEARDFRLEPRRRAAPRHLLQVRQVLAVINLVEERLFLGL